MQNAFGDLFFLLEADKIVDTKCGVSARKERDGVSYYAMALTDPSRRYLTVFVSIQRVPPDRSLD